MAFKAFDDLSEFINKVDEIGECKTIEGAERETDIGTVTESEAEQPNPQLLLFDKIQGYPSGYRVALDGSGENVIFTKG